MSKRSVNSAADPENSGTPAQPRYEYDYTDYGTLSTIRDAKGRETSFTYDQLNRQLTRMLPLGQTEYQEYDTFGRVSTKTDFKGQVTEFVYDGYGRIAEKRLYAAGSVSPDESIGFQYDALGRQSQIIEARGNTDFAYDIESNLTQIVTPEGTANYAYDATTKRKTRTWTDNADVRYDYDQIGRLETVSCVKREGQALTPPEVTTYSYTDVGSRESTELPNGVETTYQYDDLNRLTSLSHVNAASQQLATYGYTLAPDGRRTGLTETMQQPDGQLETNTITYTYDDLNRLTGESAVSQDTGHSYSGDYVYDLVGNRLERLVTVNPQILQTLYSYDDNDRLTSEVNTITTVSLSDPEYNRLGFSAYGGIYSGSGRDDLMSHLKAFFRGMPTKVSWYIFILALVLILMAFCAPLTEKLSNRMRRLWGRDIPHRNMPSASLRWRRSLFIRCVAMMMAYIMLLCLSFDVMAQQASSYQQLSATDWGEAGATTTYEYDENGSVISKTVTGTDAETIEYTYNLENRLASMQSTRDVGGQEVIITTSYVYDQSGIRVRSDYIKTIDGVVDEEETKIFLVDSYNHTGYAQVLEELPAVGAVPTVSYIIGDDVITQSRADAGYVSEHFLYDGHGSTRQLADASSAITDCFSYDAYGVMLGGNPTSDAPATTSMLYTGEQFDYNLQQYYLRARYYDQNSGRFNRLDPFAGSKSNPQSLNKFSYCENDPVDKADPPGRYGIDVHYAYTFIKALEVNIPEEFADVVAWVTKAVDDGPTRPWPPPSLHLLFYAKMLRKFHFPGKWLERVKADDPQVRHELEKSIEECNPIKIGVFLHIWQDSFSHQGYMLGHILKCTDQIYSKNAIIGLIWQNNQRLEQMSEKLIGHFAKLKKNLSNRCSLSVAKYYATANYGDLYGRIPEYTHLIDYILRSKSLWHNEDSPFPKGHEKRRNAIITYTTVEEQLQLLSEMPGI